MEEDVPGDVSQQGRCRLGTDGRDPGQERHRAGQEGLWREQATKVRGGSSTEGQTPRTHLPVRAVEIPQQTWVEEYRSQLVSQVRWLSPWRTRYGTSGKGLAWWSRGNAKLGAGVELWVPSEETDGEVYERGHRDGAGVGRRDEGPHHQRTVFPHTSRPWCSHERKGSGQEVKVSPERTLSGGIISQGIAILWEGQGRQGTQGQRKVHAHEDARWAWHMLCLEQQGSALPLPVR